MSKKPNNPDLLRQYQTEAEDHRTRKIQEKSNKINEERNEMRQLNDQLEQESQTIFQNRQNHINSQRQDYERFMTEKVSRQKSSDYRKKTSEPQGTFKIGGEDREIKRKNKNDFESDLPLNPTRNVNIPNSNINNYNSNNNKLNNEYYENLNSNMNILQQNRNRNQGYNIISGQTAQQSANAQDYARNDYIAGRSQAQPMSETPKLRHNIQSKANNASYNPINHTDNSNYYSNNVTTSNNSNLNTNTNGNYYSNQKNFNAGRDNSNRNYNNLSNKYFDQGLENNYNNRANLNVNNKNIYNNQKYENLQYEDDYENIARGDPNKDLRQESEGNEHDQGEKYKNLSDEGRRKLYEEYMRKYGANNDHENNDYNPRTYEKDHEVNFFINFSKKLK